MILGQDAVILRSAQLVHHGLVCENVRVHNINELRTVGLEETMLLCRISARARAMLSRSYEDMLVVMPTTLDKVGQ